MSDKKIIMFSFDGINEHIGELKNNMSKNFLFIENVFTVMKAPDKNGGIVINLLPPFLSASNSAEFNVNRDKCVWIIHDSDKINKDLLELYYKEVDYRNKRKEEKKDNPVRLLEG